jgi:SAM-dependent methyltransferase
LTAIAAWSLPITTERVLELIEPLDWPHAKVADVGAGAGYFSQQLSDRLRARGLSPGDHISACDVMPDSFACEGVECAKVGADGKLPFPDERFDAVVSIEVIEHVEDQFAFLRELARIAKPGAPVVVTTPNVLNINSRLRTLVSGFPVLYDPLPLDSHDPRWLGGHIHPVSPYFLGYAAIRAGLVRPELHADRIKKSGMALAALLSPLLVIGRGAMRARMARKYPDELKQNRQLLAEAESWRMLTCRTAVLRAWKPSS